MKKKTLLFTLAVCLLPLGQSCSSDADELAADIPVQPVAPAEQEADAAYYPKDDGAEALPYDPAEALSILMEFVHPNQALEMGELNITETQLAEIKDFVDKNLAKSTTQATYQAIFRWVVANCKWSPEGAIYVDPYDVFINRTCVCQGFANLLKTMLITQNIPCCTVNGYLNGAGHAWNYVNIDGEWWVSDPTNNQYYLMSNLNAYRSVLMPLRTDIDSFFEDAHCAYGFQNGRLTVVSVKPGEDEVLVVPFSAGGYRVTSFSPLVELPANYKTVYLSSCISDFGQYVHSTAEKLQHVENVYIDPANPAYEVYKGVVYQRYQDAPYLIPGGMRRVELRVMKCMEKNTIYNLPNVEEIVIADGTEEVEAYAIENCPLLKRVYVPESVKVFPDNAVYGCPADVEIIRGSTGIGHIRL